MGETTDQIERHIYEKRHELDDNIHELRHKVKNAVDWRVQTQERPWTMVGLAFGAGLLTSALIGKRRRSDSFRSDGLRRWNRESTSRSEYAGEHEERTSQIWSNVKAAVAAVAVAAAKEFVEQIIPGFREQYRKRALESETLLSRSA
jgi:hypothetical protein